MKVDRSGSRRAATVLLALLAGLALVAGCASGGSGAAGGSAGPATSTAAPVPVSYEPGPSATEVSPAAPVAASVPDGTLRDVVLTGDDGETVPGAVSADGRRWTATGALAYGTSYTWSGTATGPGGAPSPLAGSFATLRPGKTVRASLNIGDGREVGVAAPVEIQFDDAVSDKAAVERALAVTTSVPVEGSWAWLPDQDGGSRVHWRPKEYWPAGTKVEVAANLLGVPFGEGAYGKDTVTTSFAIGRAQVVKADVNSFRMVVERDGTQVMDVPASYGTDSDPRRTTRSGIHVITEKFTDKRMTSPVFGYDVMSKWAVRMSNNGEFVHANPDSADAQGSSNVTHGCVNLSTADARKFYDTAVYGDPVEVTGSGVDLSPSDGDIYDWAVSWPEWTSMSALA